jgi:O-antigen/teichoic acid export membrane protein
MIFKRGDLGSEEGRAQERHRRVALAALASVVAKGLGLLSLAITVPLTLHYLGPERYGIWVSIAGLQIMLGFADLGLGYGLVNALSTAEGLGDPLASRQTVSSAFFMLAGIGAVLGLLAACAWPWLPWAWVFNVHDAATVPSLGPALAIFTAIFCLGLPLSIGIHGHAGLQEGFRASLFQGAGNLIALASILTAVKLQAGLPVLVLASTGAPVLAQGLACLDLFGRRRPDLRPSWAMVRRERSWPLLRHGGLFFVIQVCVAVAFQADNLVLAHILGPASVATYSVTQKIFQQVPLLLSFVLMPLWPAYAESLARGDVAWIRQTLKRSFQLSLAVNVPAALILFFGTPWLIGLWVGPSVQPPLLLLQALALWTLASTIHGPLAIFLNGAGALVFQATFAVLLAVSNLAFSILFTKAYGMAGVVLGNLLAQVLFNYIPCAFYVPRLLQRLQARAVLKEA